MTFEGASQRLAADHKAWYAALQAVCVDADDDLYDDDMLAGDASEGGRGSPANRRNALEDSEDDEDDDAASQEGEAGKGGADSTKLLPRTKAMQTLLRRELKDKEEICFQDLAEGESRHGVAGCFFELLVLKTKGLIELNQDEAYGSIVVTSA